MKAQILYATMTGHSKKIAKAISDKTGTASYDLKDNPKIQPCEILFIVSGIYGGEYKAELLEYIKTISPKDVKRVAMITSSTKNAAQGGLRKALANAGFTVETEEFMCQGSFLVKAMGHPNQSEIDNAVKYARKIMERASANV